MIKKPKTPCAGCSQKGATGSCSTSDTGGGCPGESWKCLLKKWHFVGILALITGFGTKIPDRIIDSLFPPEKEKIEEPITQQKGFKIIAVLGRLENGDEIVIIKPDKDKKETTQPPILDAKQIPPSAPQHISTKPVPSPSAEPNVYK